MSYTQLTQGERYQIAILKERGLNNTQIAKAIARSPATIGRELKRNAGTDGYTAAHAQQRAQSRPQGRNNARSISPQRWERAQQYLRLGLSPEQVRGRLRLEGQQPISHEWMYQRIYQDKAQGGDLVRFLRCQKVRRKRYASGQERRGALKNCVRIDHRPNVVETRTRIGDWEGDTVIGKGQQGALVTLVERKSRYALAALVQSRHSRGVGESIIELLGPHKAQCHTITFDNGKEFAEHEYIAKRLSAQVYFAHPYHSWERGLNENTNGLLRQYFPKSTNFLHITQDAVNEAVYSLNHRPRKCLGYRTPHEAFYGFEIRPLTLTGLALRS